MSKELVFFVAGYTKSSEKSITEIQELKVQVTVWKDTADRFKKVIDARDQKIAELGEENRNQWKDQYNEYQNDLKVRDQKIAAMSEYIKALEGRNSQEEEMEMNRLRDKAGL